jgi:predicted peptidase
METAMKIVFLLMWLGVCLMLTSRVWAEETQKQRQVAKVMTFEDGAKLDYWFYEPQGEKAAGQKFPLMLFLHGAGERGDDINRVLQHGPPMQIKKGKDFPAYVISPQCPQKKWWPAGDMIKELDLLLKEVCNNYPIDRSRIYITGLSMGGMGTMALVQTLPDRFAAAIPICGKGDVSKAAKMVDVPMWFFHGEADKTVPSEGSTAMVDAIKAAGGTKVKLTLYQGVGHNSWTQTYNNPEVYDWLFAQHQ